MSEGDSNFTIERIPLDDNPDFNDYLDQHNPVVEIEGGIYRPSEVLNAIDPDAYRSVLEEYRIHEEERFKQLVLNEFPNPIAYSFSMAENGFDNERHRLDCLRDAWEALINLLYAIVIGESLSLGLSLREAKVITGPTEQTPVNTKHLTTDTPHVKIGLMAGILRMTAEQGISMVCAEFVTDEILSALRALKKDRNDVAHSTALSEREAHEQFIKDANIFLPLLRQVTALQHVRLLRFQKTASHALDYRFELFQGHATTKRFTTLTLNTTQLQTCAHYLNSDNIVVHVGEHIYRVSPFVYFVERGGETRLCLYKKIHSDQYLYSVIGQAAQVTLTDSTLTKQFDEVKSLLRPRGSK